MTTPTSPLIDDDLRAQLGDVLGKLERDVLVVSIYDDENPACNEMRDFLEVVATLSPHVRTRHIPQGEQPKLEAQLEAHLLPVAALCDPEGNPVGVRFHGVPGGQEINSFVLALYNYAGPGQALEPELRNAVMALAEPADIKICVSLACHYCPATVTACQRMALLNPCISAAMVDIRLYPDLLKKFGIERVPVLIVNDESVHVGAKDMKQVCALLH